MRFIGFSNEKYFYLQSFVYTKLGIWGKKRTPIFLYCHDCIREKSRYSSPFSWKESFDHFPILYNNCSCSTISWCSAGICYHTHILGAGLFNPVPAKHQIIFTKLFTSLNLQMYPIKKRRDLCKKLLIFRELYVGQSCLGGFKWFVVVNAKCQMP